MKVLIVDDSPTHAELCRLVLRILGHEATVAIHGKDALNKLKEDRYDCILLDCLMPELDGFATAQTIRNPNTTLFNPGIYIVGMSGTADQDSRDRCLASGMNLFVEKPLSKQVLELVLGRLESTWS
jgi:CheY-like chemotaxis protein